MKLQSKHTVFTNMSIKVGSKMLYCKVAGDKSSEEVVEVVAVQSEAQGGGVTIFIPSLKRERDTELSRLAPIVEKKKFDTEKVKKELEEMKRRCNELFEKRKFNKGDICFIPCGFFDGKPDYDIFDIAKVVRVWSTDRCVKYTIQRCRAELSESSYSPMFKDVKETELYTREEIPEGVEYEHEENDDNFFDVTSSEDDLYTLSERIEAVVESKLRSEIYKLRNDVNDLRGFVIVQGKQISLQTTTIAELRRFNTSLMVNQQAMAKELQEMRAEMALMRQCLRVAGGAHTTNPLVAMGTKI